MHIVLFLIGPLLFRTRSHYSEYGTYYSEYDRTPIPNKTLLLFRTRPYFYSEYDIIIPNTMLLIFRINLITIPNTISLLFRIRSYYYSEYDLIKTAPWTG